MKNIAIDIHSHLNHGAEFDTNHEGYGLIYRTDLDFLKEEQKRTNVICAAYSTFDGVMSTNNVVRENDYMYQLVQKEEGVYFWSVLNPLDKKTYDQAEKLLKDKKCLGLKIHSVCHQYDIIKYGNEIFDFASQMNSWVLMHNDKITDMVQFANKYPKMNLIIAHLGSLEHVAAIKNAIHGNIYTDTSGMKSYYNNIVEYAVGEVGAEKIFFGTDTYSIGFQKGRIEYANISDCDKEKILYKNAIDRFCAFNELIKSNTCD